MPDFTRPMLEWHNWKDDYQPIYPLPDKREMYSLDSCLAPFIAERLKFFRNYVATDFPCYPCSLESMEEWLTILDKMIYAFENHDENWMFEDENYNRLKQHPASLFNHPEVQAWRDKCDEGRRLFAEWFTALWT